MLKRGLYEQIINKSLDRELERSDDIAASTGKLDGAEAPQILSHYISELVGKKDFVRLAPMIFRGSFRLRTE